MSLRLTVSAAVLALAAFASSAAQADEGMWTFDNFPTATVNAKYGTDIDQRGWTACAARPSVCPAAARPRWSRARGWC
ncbi:hypothetical protein [Brevundimonas abyssalis]|uniref:hypothetical protein n=1 Tax=Brevundimonas abyssalis TaxID=1125965 RepID=UPI00041BD344|nr:hypothetical protein [Brevundimonas abyssalis]